MNTETYPRCVLPHFDVVALPELDLRCTRQTHIRSKGRYIKLLKIEGVLVPLHLYRSDITDKSLLCQVLDVGILETEILKLIRNALLLLLADIRPFDGNFLLLQLLQHTRLLARVKEHYCVSCTLKASCAAHTMHVSIDILGRIDLDDPVDCRKVDTSSNNIGRE